MHLVKVTHYGRNSLQHENFKNILFLTGKSSTNNKLFSL